MLNHNLTGLFGVEKIQKMDGLIDRFEEEKISPDIVCQLSLHELKELGLQSRSEITTLRIACVTFGGEQPMKFLFSDLLLSISQSQCLNVIWKKSSLSQKLLI